MITGLRIAIVSCLVLPPLAFSSLASQAQLKPFTTDFCSSFPEGPPSDPQKWGHCCVMHDLEYWIGGARDQREEADRELRRCVSETGESFIAGLMYSAVRVAGRPGTGKSYRWGYGWPNSRGYEVHTEEELDQIEALWPQDPLDPKWVVRTPGSEAATSDVLDI